MRAFPVLLLALAPALAACHRHDADLTARVEALEAQYHSQARRLKTLEAEVDALQGDKGAPVVDLTKKEGEGKEAAKTPAPPAPPETPTQP